MPPETPLELIIAGTRLTFEEAVRVAREPAVRVRLAPAAKQRLDEVRRFVEEHWLAEGPDGARPIYGFNTGVGALKGFRVPTERIDDFQRHYVRAHCVGVGPDLPDETVRAALLLRANSLASGFSGVRSELVEALLVLLNARIHPKVPAVGSLGASGDLAPLAHVGAVLIGEPDARVAWPGGEGTVADLLETGIDWRPIGFAAKEAMALTNGTSFMLALAILLLEDARRCLRSADLAAALSLEAMQGEIAAFDGRLVSLRPQPGQQVSAANVRDLVEGSGLLGNHPSADPRVQDAYSLRCVPQVHGASRDALRFLAEVVDQELNAVTDNPLLIPEGDHYCALSGGNFHGQPLAFALDLAGLALAELGSISERRLFRLLTSHLSYGLPENLTGGDPGLNTGYMIVQYTAAALVAENKILCRPASCDSIPSSGDQEDHVSLGVHAGRKAESILRNVEQVLGMECLGACQGIDLAVRRLGRAARPGRGTAAAHRALRESGIEPLGEDRYLKPEIDASIDAVRSGALLRCVSVEGIELRD
ncbi:MAG: histidine ammonia-lyase [Candidatus Eisenbacteria bacterium]|nr:histidine ammonia-lyase [Candidatus Latescibacterota bacterium]MBD3302964.1 histidine ammonia-lyase [Candidatus Eisenbacteria bacterium]